MVGGRRTLALFAVGVLAAGCGTAVSLSGGQAPSVAGGAGLAGGTPAAERLAVGSPGTRPESPGGFGASWSGTGNTQATSLEAGGPGAAPGSVLKLGFVIGSTDQIASFPPGAPPEDFRAIITALVDDANRHGGIAGRHVVPDWVIDDPPPYSQASDVATEQESDCLQLTEDDHVAAVVAIADVSYAVSCYAKHHTPLFTRTFETGLDDRELQALSPWVLPDDSPDLDTVARIMAAGLAREGFIDRHLGIMAADAPQVHRAVEQVLIPALRAYGGVAASHDVYFSVLDIQHGTQATQNATLAWKTDGVDRVILFDVGGNAWPVMSEIADQYAFYPRWGMDSQDQAQYDLDQQSEPVPSDQRDVTSIGYYPMFDVHDDSYPLQAPERRCLNTVNAALGTRYGHRDIGTGGAALLSCRSIDFVTRVLAGFAGRPLDARQVREAVNQLGTSYRPLDVPQARFAAGKPDGLAVFRTARYVASCKCMRYDSPWRDAPASG